MLLILLFLFEDNIYENLGIEDQHVFSRQTDRTTNGHLQVVFETEKLMFTLNTLLT